MCCFLVDRIENVSFLSTGLGIADNFLVCVKTSLSLKHFKTFFYYLFYYYHIYYFIITTSDLSMPWPGRLWIFRHNSTVYLMAAYLT